ncbi:MAG: type 1 glutamine amidotransferase [Candidatus Omnitrophica bacterium]|nr:type 1 glutamine amidotransferase [Candidatus Omnitrophota bacterium]
MILTEQNIPYEIIDFDKGEAFPSPRKCSALIVLGGPDSANDKTPKMKEQLGRIREALSLGIPYLGICLGLQTLVKGAGGGVVKSPVQEIGFRDPKGNPFEVQLTEAGRKDPLLSGIPTSFKVFQLHGETVTLTPRMTLLGKGDFCTNQMVRVGTSAYGLQFHLEMTSVMLDLWGREDSDLKQMNQTTLHQEFEALHEVYEKVGRRLFTNFLQIASLLPAKIKVV